MKCGFDSGSRRPQRWPIVASVKAICLLAISISSSSLGLSATASAHPLQTTSSTLPPVPCLQPAVSLETGLQPAAGIPTATPRTAADTSLSTP